MMHLEQHCPKCDEREAAHLAYAARFRKLHLQLVKLTVRYSANRLKIRRLERTIKELKEREAVWYDRQ